MDMTQENMDKLVETLSTFPTTVERIVRSVMVPQSATSFEAFTVTLPVNGQPILLLGLDRSRTRTLLSTTVDFTRATDGETTGVKIGHFSSLGAGAGSYLTSGAATELRTTDEIFAIYQSDASEPNSAAIVSVWVEKVVGS
jgi:hypothetical protein